MDYVPSHLCAVMCAFSSGTGSYAEMEMLSTTVQESLDESQQICKVSMLCQHGLTTHKVYTSLQLVQLSCQHFITISYKLITSCVLHKCVASQRLYIIVLFQLGKHSCNVDSFEFDCLYVLLILLTKDREARLVEANQQIAKQSEDRCALEQQMKNLESQR